MIPPKNQKVRTDNWYTLNTKASHLDESITYSTSAEDLRSMQHNSLYLVNLTPYMLVKSGLREDLDEYGIFVSLTNQQWYNVKDLIGNPNISIAAVFASAISLRGDGRPEPTDEEEG